jgi:hypothetical protein
VAMNTDSSIQTRPDYATFGLVFIFVGLAVLSSAINLIVMRLTPTCPDDSGDSSSASDGEKSSNLPTVLTINVTGCQPEDVLAGQNKKKMPPLSMTSHCSKLTEVNGITWNGFVVNGSNCSMNCDQNHCCHL